MTLVINLFGGPGCGKSTTATGVFSLLKIHDVNAEYISEFAKDKAWEETLGICYNPYQFLGEQHHRQFRCIGKTDVIITDSPLLQQYAYVPDDDFYEKSCLELFNRFDNHNYFIRRTKKFNPKGRKHNEESSRELDDTIIGILEDHNIKYKTLEGNHKAVNKITEDILSLLRLKMIHKIC